LKSWRFNVPTLKTRLDALERASPDTDRGGVLDLPPVMEVDEWCEAAAKQQAELCREVSNGNT
jgi:hypothetical protein